MLREKLLVRDPSVEECDSAKVYSRRRRPGQAVSKGRVGGGHRRRDASSRHLEGVETSTP